MKLRFRLKKISRVVEVNDDIVDNFTIEDLYGRAVDAYNDVIAGEFYLSLNNKDALEGDRRLLSECDIVSGDLIYVVPVGGWYEPEMSSSDVSMSSSSSSIRSNVPTSSTCKPTSKLSLSFQTVRNETQPSTSQPCVGTSTQQPGCVQSEHGQDKHGNIADTSCDITDDSAMETESETNQVDCVIVKQCLSEPTLCREATDSRVPPLLKELYDSTKPNDIAESLCVVLHVLMLETGFNSYPETETGSKLPDNFRCTGFYKFAYKYPGCQDKLCTVTIVPTGGSVVVHGKVSDDECISKKCSLKPYEFVQNVTEDCTECYCQLAKLSRIYKDSMCIPLVHDIRQASGLPDLIGLLALTQEIKLKILSFLDLRSLLQMSSVNQEFMNICSDPYVWRRLYLKEFGNRSDMSFSQDWKKLYKHEFKVRKERRKALSRMRMVTPPYWTPVNPYGGANNWIPPPVPGGIIGGDYDLFPGGYPGIPSRTGPQAQVLPRPRYDLIGPTPDVDPGPDPDLIPTRPTFPGRSGGGRAGPFGFGGFGPRFF